MSNAELKNNAKKSLKGNYSLMVFVTLLFALLEGACYLLSEILDASFTSSLFMLIINSLIFMGMISMILKISRNEKVEFNDLFSKTDYMFKYFGITILSGVILLLMWALEFLSFNSLVIILQYSAEINSVLLVALVAIGIILSTGVILAAIYLAIAFSQIYFIMSDNPNMPILKVMGRSFDMMSGYTVKYFTLCLSFIGWAILGLFTLGILYLWLIPYYYVTLANFYNQIDKEYKELYSEDDDLFGDAAKEEANPEKKDNIENLF